MSAQPHPSSPGQSFAAVALAPGTLAALREGLSDDEWRQLQGEAEVALRLAFRQAPPDLQPLLEVIEAWYRTMFVRQDPGYQVAIRERAGKTAEELGERVYTGEDLQRRLRH
ncbi:MAG: hypothetical protein JF888_02975 [Candidatus Dormibacteraeota bacterium]|uniref:Uncharacterized protein n=1 Tax=Candidatus Dormiibacter inghamiae TaxID=3127013 RepID=A0A934NCJ7_9BACT|nr:hypothetical protein [Candidatus Dormibacteraeota bacterium]PZR94960.1 MAG: hypothetical protein DLM67_11765 [Candidatus Dormibacteraeota bacterium]